MAATPNSPFAPATFLGVTEAQQTTTCYRHPDRTAGVVCQRCDRPICAWCMNQASVGFHCPECLKSGKQEVRTGAAAFGGVDRGVVTMVIIALNVAVFAIGLGGGGGVGQRTSVTADFAIFGPAIDLAGEWYRIITGAFLHANLIHLGFNMYLVWIIGRQLEAALGWWRFSLLYFATLLAGSFGVLLVSPTAFTVGASGAGFGLFGALMVAQRANGINIWDSGLAPILLLNLVLTFGVRGISIGGHVGGLLGGLLVGWLFWESPKVAGNRWFGDAAVVAFGVLMFLGSLWAATTWTDPVF
jgi:membrane associated rhomboid family serine protease